LTKCASVSQAMEYRHGTVYNQAIVFQTNMNFIHTG
jgi:hypothetical protein